jgi:hypothetical protein
MLDSYLHASLTLAYQHNVVQGFWEYNSTTYFVSGSSRRKIIAFRLQNRRASICQFNLT